MLLSLSRSRDIVKLNLVAMAVYLPLNVWFVLIAFEKHWFCWRFIVSPSRRWTITVELRCIHHNPTGHRPSTFLCAVFSCDACPIPVQSGVWSCWNKWSDHILKGFMLCVCVRVLPPCWWRLVRALWNLAVQSSPAREATASDLQVVCKICK